MARNKMNDLRDHLFVALERLGDDDLMSDPAKLEAETQRAKAIVNVSNSLIESAKVEIDFLKVTGSFKTDTPLLGSIKQNQLNS